MYFPRTNVPKSERLYSERSSSAAAVLAFLMELPFRSRCRTRGDDPNLRRHLGGCDHEHSSRSAPRRFTPSSIAVEGRLDALSANFLQFLHASAGRRQGPSRRVFPRFSGNGSFCHIRKLRRPSVRCERFLRSRPRPPSAFRRINSSQRSTLRRRITGCGGPAGGHNPDGAKRLVRAGTAGCRTPGQS